MWRLSRRGVRSLRPAATSIARRSCAVVSRPDAADVLNALLSSPERFNTVVNSALESGAGAMSDAGMLNMLAIDALHGFKNPKLWKTGLKNDVIRQAAYTADQKALLYHISVALDIHKEQTTDSDLSNMQLAADLDQQCGDCWHAEFMTLKPIYDRVAMGLKRLSLNHQYLSISRFYRIWCALYESDHAPIAIEVDGPWNMFPDKQHYSLDTLLRLHNLQQQGWAVMHILPHEWDDLSVSRGAGTGKLEVFFERIHGSLELDARIAASATNTMNALGSGSDPERNR